MKRVTAFILSLIMILSGLPSIPLWGATTYATQLGLGEARIKVGGTEKEATIALNNGTLELVEKKVSSNVDEVTVKWNIGDNRQIKDGVYNLNYYTSEAKGTNLNKVNLELQVGKKYDETNNLVSADNYIGIKVKVENEPDVKIKRRISPYNQGNMAPEGEQIGELLHNINILSENPEDREFVADIVGISVVKMFVKDNQVFLSVTGIEKDYITPFKLEYKKSSVDTTPSETEEVKIFKGFSEFKILPTHLVEQHQEGITADKSEIGLPSQHIIDLGQKGTAAFVEPGSKPGIVVRLSKPKKITEVGGVIEAKKIDKNDPHNVQLRLGEILDVGQEIDDKTQLKVTFGLYDGATIVNTQNSNKAEVHANGEFLELYFVNDKKIASIEKSDEKYLMEWNYLKAGMLVAGEIDLIGNIFEPTENTLHYKLDKPGYTYIEYDLNRMSDKNMVFQVTPYNISSRVEYGLFMKKFADTNPPQPPSIEPNLGKEWIDLEKRYHIIDPKQPTFTFTTQHRSTKEKYLITTTYLGMEFFSQMIQYSGENTNVPPPYPEITKTDNAYVVTDSFIEKEPDTVANQLAVGMDVTWKCPADMKDMEDVKKYLDKGKIYYEFYLSDDSKKETDNLISVIEASLDKSNSSKETIVLTPYKGKVLGNITYNEKTNQYTAEGLVLKDRNSKSWMALEMPKNYENKISYPLADDIKVLDNKNYALPGTYYITVRAVYQKDSEGTQDFLLGVSDPSNPKAVSLDYTHKVLPSVDYITSDIVGEDITSQKTWIKPVDLKEYVKLMIDPLGYKLYKESGEEQPNLRYQRVYEVYFAQSKMDDGSNQGKLDPERIQKIEYDDIKGTPTISLTDELKKELRENQAIFKIEIESTENTGSLIPIVWENLELNTPYYMKVLTRIDIYEGLTKIGKVESLYSKTHSFTTSTKPLPPGIDEQVPPAPSEFAIVGDVGDTNVTLGWKAPTYAQGQEKQIYYELIRTTDTALPTDLLNPKFNIENVVDKNASYKGFHTAHDMMEKYEKGKWSIQEPEQKSGFRLEENTLLPNRVYYYYIRTVYSETTDRGTEGAVEGDKVYSEWIMLPVTTSPIKRPIQLAIEPQSKELTYDGQHETVISFLAPLPADSNVPKDFSFDIAIKDSESGKEYIVAVDGQQEEKVPYTITKLKEEEYSTEYKYFVYKISGLKHSTRYDIKVRIVDKTGQEISRSLYSEKVTMRTDFSEEDQEEENAFNKYLEAYDREVEKLKRRPYWNVDTSKNLQAYKYRKSYIQSELASFKTYSLIADETGSSVYYYLPSSFFEEMLKNNTLVTIQLGDYTATLRAGMLKNNATLIEVQEKIEKGTYADYYIGLEFSLVGLTGTISGAKVISPEIVLEMEVIYVNREDLIIEDTILDGLNELIDEGRKDVVKELERYVVGGKIDDDKLTSIIEKTISWVENKHCIQVAKVLDTRIKKHVTISDIQMPVYLEAILDTYEVQGYYDNGSKWETIYVTNIGGKLSLEMNRLGSYALTGKSSSSVLVPDIAGGSQLISKYQLTEFFDIEKGLNQNVTREKVYGAVARVLGARQGTDYILYLKDRGITLIIPNAIYQPIRQDEAIYIIMQAYEKMYYKNINAITISNKLTVSNIGAFQPQYKPYVYAAVELGVVIPENNKVLPSKLLSAKDIIRMLTKIVPK